MTQRYKIVKAEDGILWISLQPLFLDLEEARDNAPTQDAKDRIQTALELISSLIIEGEAGEASE
jgi:hypothetical protein